jgi:hypothetical protein
MVRGCRLRIEWKAGITSASYDHGVCEKVMHRSDEYAMYCCTFTRYRWLSLFEITNGYDLVYRWFEYLTTRKKANVVAYVIMPNHLYTILYFQKPGFDLNKLIGNAKRLMAYRIIDRLISLGCKSVLEILEEGCSWRDINKGQKHWCF